MKETLVVNLWGRGLVIITDARTYSSTSEIRFCAGSNPSRGVWEICDGENH